MKKLGKLGVAVVLVGLFIVGCGESGGGLVKLENKNPTIDQKNYDFYMKKLQESEIKGGSHNFQKTIKTSEYDFYHFDSVLEYSPIKEIVKKKKKECKDSFKNKELSGEEKGFINILCDNIGIGDNDRNKSELKEKGNLKVFAVNKKNPKDFYEILLSCYGKCKNTNDLSIYIYNIQERLETLNFRLRFLKA